MRYRDSKWSYASSHQEIKSVSNQRSISIRATHVPPPNIPLPQATAPHEVSQVRDPTGLSN